MHARAKFYAIMSCEKYYQFQVVISRDWFEELHVCLSFVRAHWTFLNQFELETEFISKRNATKVNTGLKPRQPLKEFNP